MITIFKTDTIKMKDKDKSIYYELRGLSTDNKPLVVGNKDIANGSIFVEIDTGKIFLFDGQNKQWKEI